MRAIPCQTASLVAGEVDLVGPLRQGADGHLVIVALTPAVARLAQVARAIRQAAMAPETGSDEGLGPPRGGRSRPPPPP